jgi:RNA polymerase sigma factor (TIGR02999 family)
MSDVTQLLRDWSGGDPAARDELLARVYGPLRELAERHLRKERDGHTLQPTALVNELYLKFVEQRKVEWQDRAHFFGVAAEVMRRILVDYARRRNAEKRGGGAGAPVTLSDVHELTRQAEVDIVALDVALESLAKVFPRQAKLVELRFYGGLTLDETATVMGISPATVSREWMTARARCP